MTIEAEAHHSQIMINKYAACTDKYSFILWRTGGSSPLSVCLLHCLSCIFSITLIRITSFAQHLLSNISDIVSRREIQVLWCIVWVGATELRSKSAGKSISFILSRACLIFKPFKNNERFFTGRYFCWHEHGVCVNSVTTWNYLGLNRQTSEAGSWVLTDLLHRRGRKWTTEQPWSYSQPEKRIYSCLEEAVKAAVISVISRRAAGV